MIVRENPKEYTVHFGGANGRRIRQHYMSLILQTIDDNGQPILEKVFKDIDNSTESYTFRAPKGLLFATQFTQVAISLVELARYKHMQSRGLIPDNSSFAGHSLGEYPALAAFAEFFSIEQFVAIGFYRGMTMQAAVKRDEHGASNYSLCAVNPSRISKLFEERTLRFITSTIAQETGWLLEIVNFNISDRQYVCAGELIALDCLTKLLDSIATKRMRVESINQAERGLDESNTFLSTLRTIVQEVQAKATTAINLQRGLGIVPLEGIDVPFHSTFLRPGISTFREFLASHLNPAAVEMEKLVDRWIPNLTGKPFRTDRSYFEHVYKLTGSVKLEKLLKGWVEIDT